MPLGPTEARLAAATAEELNALQEIQARIDAAPVAVRLSYSVPGNES